MKDYQIIGKTLFFPKQGILAVGDLHLGFEYKLQQSGILIPEMQIKEVKEELKEVFSNLKNKKMKLKKIIFIGDIKHAFSYEWKEKSYFKEIINFLMKYIQEKNIILIKGNHDTIDYSFSDKLKDYFIEGELAFIHGHKEFPAIFNKKIKKIIMGHIHPSVFLADKQGIKKEKYKCFLVGRYKKKKIIILPSFLSEVEGATINQISESERDFSFIPNKNLKNFDVFVAGEKENYKFGKVNRLDFH